MGAPFSTFLGTPWRELTVEPVFAWISGNLHGSERPGSESPRERGRKEAEPAQQPPGATRSIPLRLRPGTEQKRISRLQSPSAQSYSHRAGCAHDPRLSMWSSGQPLPLCQQGGLGTGQAQSGGHPGGARRVHTKEVTAAVAGGKAEAQRVWHARGVLGKAWQGVRVVGWILGPRGDWGVGPLQPGGMHAPGGFPWLACITYSDETRKASSGPFRHHKTGKDNSQTEWVSQSSKDLDRLEWWLTMSQMKFNKGRRWLDGAPWPDESPGGMNIYLKEKKSWQENFLILSPEGLSRGTRAHTAQHHQPMSTSQAVPPPDTNSLVSALHPGREQEWLVGLAFHVFVLKVLKHRN